MTVEISEGEIRQNAKKFAKEAARFLADPSFDLKAFKEEFSEELIKAGNPLRNVDVEFRNLDQIANDPTSGLDNGVIFHLYGVFIEKLQNGESVKVNKDTILNFLVAAYSQSGQSYL